MKEAVNDVIRQLLDGDLQHYQERRHFRLQEGEVMHIAHRVSISFEEKHTVTEYGDDNQEYNYEANKEREFFWHVWFDNHGRIWFLCDTKGQYPRYDGEFPFKPEREYDRRVGTRYYFFHDIIHREVMDAFRKLNDESKIDRIYTWGGFELSVEKLTDTDKEMLYPPSIFSFFS